MAASFVSVIAIFDTSFPTNIFLTSKCAFVRDDISSAKAFLILGFILTETNWMPMLVNSRIAYADQNHLSTPVLFGWF